MSFIKSESRWWGLISVIFGLLVGVAVGQFQREALAEAAGQSAAVIMLVGSTFWQERSRQLFWAFMVTIVVVHVIVIEAVPWPAHHKLSKGDALFGLGDFVLLLGLGLLIKRLTHRSVKTRPRT